MKYLLMHQDFEVIEIDIDINGGRLNGMGEVFHMASGISSRCIQEKCSDRVISSGFRKTAYS